MSADLLKKNSRPQVDPENPWQEDKLERRKVAEYLTPVIASVSQPFVISLNSPFGTGKSFFLECWKADLEKDGYKVLLFNAWETDFCQDVLFAFMSALQKQFESTSKNKVSAKAKKKFSKSQKPLVASYEASFCLWRPELLLERRLEKARGKN